MKLIFYNEISTLRFARKSFYRLHRSVTVNITSESMTVPSRCLRRRRRLPRKFLGRVDILLLIVDLDGKIRLDRHDTMLGGGTEFIYSFLCHKRRYLSRAWGTILSPDRVKM